MSLPEETTCPVCDASMLRCTRSIVDHEYDLDVVVQYNQCAQCGSFYQSPMPKVNTLAGYYPKDYHSFDANTLITRLKHERRLKQIASLLKSGPFRVLDYGCGNGSFLEHCSAKFPGAHLVGYEIAEKKEILLKNNGHVKIIKGSFQDLLAEMPSVDLISMHHVIEHLPDPWGTLRSLYGKISPSGFFIGQTPASNSFEYRVFKKNWSGFHAPRHTVIFSTPGMNTFLKRAGFAHIQVKGAFNPGGIAVSLASLPHRGKRGRIKRQGPGWLFYVALASVMYPLDVLSGQPGIMDFMAQKQQ